MPIELPKRLQALYSVFEGPGFETDVTITTLLAALDATPSTAYPQQYLGSYVTRLNRRLRAHGCKVTPGRLKQTYRLTRV